MLTPAFVAVAGVSALAFVLGDLQLAFVTAVAAYGLAAWRNYSSMAVAAALHVLAASASPAAVYVLLKAAPAATAVFPLRESPAAVPAAFAAAFVSTAVEQLLSSVRDVVVIAEHLPYAAAALAVALLLYAARR